MKVNKIIELVALVVGGLSLFMASFLIFALSAGVPAHEVALVGGLFPKPASTVSGTSGESINPANPDVVDKTMDDVVIATIGRLPAYQLQSAFNDDELAEVVNELKRVKAEFEEGIVDIEKREADVETHAANLEERARVLNEYMATIDRRELEMALVQEELDAGVKVRNDQDDARWAKKAKGYESEDDIDLHARRLALLLPEEAAQILRYLQPEQRTLILNALGDDDFQSFNDAYAAIEE